MEVVCVFENIVNRFMPTSYGCEVKNVSIEKRGQEISKFIGEHLPGKSDDDVLAISFRDNKNLQFVPRGLIKVFKNVVALNLSCCLIKSITKNDLSGMPNLKWLRLNDNQLTSLPGNLFQETQNLEKNSTINNYFDSTGSYGRAITLDQLNQIIREKCASKIVPLTTKDFAINLKAMMVSDSLKDCTIRIDGEEFKAHRLVLAAGSPVLRKMFEENPDANELQLENIPADIFKIVLEVLYDEGLEDEVDDPLTLKELLSAAFKLEMDLLKNFVAEKLCLVVDSENAAEMLMLATKCNSQILKLKAFDEVKRIFTEKKLKDDAINDPTTLVDLVEKFSALLE